MRMLTYATRQIPVEVLSLAFPRRPVRQPNGQTVASQAHLALLCPVEIPIGSAFSLGNADEPPFELRAMGCVQNGAGRFLVLGTVAD